MMSIIPRSAKVATRVTPTEYARLQALAAAQNRTLANFLYTVIKTLIRDSEQQAHEQPR